MKRILTALWNGYTYPFRLLRLSVAWWDYDMYTTYGLDDEEPLHESVWALAAWLLLYSAIAAISAPVILWKYLSFDFDIITVTGLYGAMMWIMLLFYGIPDAGRWIYKWLTNL